MNNCQTQPKIALFPGQRTNALLYLVASLLACIAPTYAAPNVEGLNLVSATRVARTIFDYKYSLRVKGDPLHYENTVFIASVTQQGSTMQQDRVNVGRVDADSFITTTDAITIRHDRQYPFNKANIKFKVLGNLQKSSDIANGPVIGPVSIIEIAGRAGHEGEYPISTSGPIAGASLKLRAEILSNSTSAEYFLKNTSNQVLVTGPLTKEWSNLPWHSARIQIPSVPFSIEVKATDGLGLVNSWKSVVKTPINGYAQLLLPYSITFGQTLQSHLVVTSVGAAGTYIVSLNRPSDFGGDSGPWTVAISPNQQITIPVKIISPAINDSTSQFATFSVSFKNASGSTPAQIWNSTVFLK